MPGESRWVAHWAMWLSLVSMVMWAAGYTWDAHAVELRKCRLPSGRMAYASDACPRGSHEIWRRDIQPDHQHDAALKRRQADIAQWQQASRREASMRLRQPAARVGSGRAGESASASRCERARQRRDRIRDKEWMRMTYDRMVKLDDDVAEACR